MKNKVSKAEENLKYLPQNQGEWLQVCVNLTQRLCVNKKLRHDDTMVLQLHRISHQLKEWKANNPTAEVRPFTRFAKPLTGA